MRSRAWLLLWVLGILFPLAFLGRLWPAFGRIFDSLFSPSWMHIVMHSLLYAVLMFLLVNGMRPPSLQAIVLLLGVVLVIGLLHECFQMLAAVGWAGFPAGITRNWRGVVFDLGIDLAGAALGLAFVSSLRLLKRKAG